ncbi:unnamed protein product, partial [Laminaria digitata]
TRGRKRQKCEDNKWDGKKKTAPGEGGVVGWIIYLRLREGKSGGYLCDVRHCPSRGRDAGCRCGFVLIHYLSTLSLISKAFQRQAKAGRNTGGVEGLEDAMPKRGEAAEVDSSLVS